MDVEARVRQNILSFHECLPGKIDDLERLVHTTVILDNVSMDLFICLLQIAQEQVHQPFN